MSTRRIDEARNAWDRYVNWTPNEEFIDVSRSGIEIHKITKFIVFDELFKKYNTKKYIKKYTFYIRKTLKFLYSNKWK